jgi:uncharacterized protein (DUF302 family)
MARIDIPTQVSVPEAVAQISSRVGSALDAEFAASVHASKSLEEFEKQMRGRQGSSGFMAFARLNHGEWTEKAGNKVDCYLFVLGNPLLAKPMIDINPLVGLYVPPRLLVYLHSDGFAHVCFDSLEDNLRDLGDERLLPQAKLVDDKLRDLAQL